MELQRPNMSDLFRSFIGRGSLPESPPEATIAIEPVVAAIAEICRPVGRNTVGPTDPLEESNGVTFYAARAAGAGDTSAVFMTLSSGLWRLSLAVTVCAIGNAPAAGNVLGAGLARPGGGYAQALQLLVPAAGIVIAQNADWLVHIPDAGWTIYITMADPVAAGSINYLAGTVYACRLL